MRNLNLILTEANPDNKKRQKSMNNIIDKKHEEEKNFDKIGSLNKYSDNVKNYVLLRNNWPIDVDPQKKDMIFDKILSGGKFIDLNGVGDTESTANAAKILLNSNGGSRLLKAMDQAQFRNDDYIKFVDAYDPTEIKQSDLIFAFFNKNLNRLDKVFDLSTSTGVKRLKNFIADIYNKWIKDKLNKNLFDTYYSLNDLKNLVSNEENERSSKVKDDPEELAHKVYNLRKNKDKKEVFDKAIKSLQDENNN